MNGQINLLPAPTWNRLGVNAAGAAFALPEVPAGGFGSARWEMGALPAGVRRSLDPDPAWAALESGMGPAFDAFVKENANALCALTAEGDNPECLCLTHTLDAAHPAAIARCGLYAAAGSSVTLLELCRSEGAVPGGLAASLTQVFAGAGAHVRLVQVQLLPESCRRWSAVAVHGEAGARVELIRAELGAGAAACGSLTALAGEESRYELQSMYFGDGERQLDFNDTALHTGARTESELYSAGVLTGQSQKTLRGTIDFRRGAVYAVGHEQEDVLLFSPGVRNRTTPLILCGEERVEGQHAASIGRLDETKLYYLASRGLSPAAAQRLLAEARFAPVLDKIPLEDLRAEILAYVERRLDACAE